MTAGADTSPTPETSEQQASGEKAGLFARTRKTVRFLAAVDTWKRRAADVRYRARFPLLRAAFRRLKRDSSAYSSFDGYTDAQLRYSATMHARILLFAVPALAVCLFTLMRGIGALVRFDEVTTWLLYSVPLSIYISCKIIVSHKSRRNIEAELEQRVNGMEQTN